MCEIFAAPGARIGRDLSGPKARKTRAPHGLFTPPARQKRGPRALIQVQIQVQLEKLQSNCKINHLSETAKQSQSNF